MNRQFIIGAVIVLLAGVGALLIWQHESAVIPDIFTTPEEITAKSIEANGPLPTVQTQAVLQAIDLSRPIRLAVGGLGLDGNEQNRILGDLVTVKLTGAPGFELVERQSLAAVLQELNLSWSGFVRAKDVLRAGKLLKADWFLLGTKAMLNGTNSIVVRVVDAHTGIMRDAGAIPMDQPVPKLVEDLVAFVQEARSNAAHPKMRVYVSIGAFKDISINNRLADFPAQVRGYLTTAYRDSNVTLLERDYVETLLQEMHLDMAGLTDENASAPSAPMQSAFWVVSGEYQSYETTNLQVEVNLQVQRVFGKYWIKSLRSPPGDAVARQIKSALDGFMAEQSGAIVVTRASEAHIQMQIGQELYLSAGGLSLLTGGFWNSGSQSYDRQQQRLDELIHIFQTVLLLEPTNRPALMYMAACLRSRGFDRLSEAWKCYQQIIDQPVSDKWVAQAKQALVWGMQRSSPDDRLRWYQAAAMQTTNPVAVAFYREQAAAAQDEITINSGGTPEAFELARKELFAVLQSYENMLSGKGGGFTHHIGLDEYAKSFGTDQTNAAKKVAEYLPELEKQFPRLEPYILANVLSMQLDPKTPLAVEFERRLDSYIQSPRQILSPVNFWNDISWTIYEWARDNTNYPLAIKVIEGERQVAASGDVRSLDFDDQERIKLGCLYMATDRWKDALEVFASFTNRPVQATGDGPWGQAFRPILTGRLADQCRQKLGLQLQPDPRQFEIGKPAMPLCECSTFVADNDGLWVGSGSLHRLRHLDFNLRTNLDIELPNNPYFTAVSVIYQGPSKIWMGTQGGGLIEFDKSSHACRQLTQSDGLMMNDIGSLALNGDTLWIGYGGPAGGGLGRLDLQTGKTVSFMRSINLGTNGTAGEDPPKTGLGRIVARPEGDLWIFPGQNIRQFHPANGSWQTLPAQAADWLTAFDANSHYLVEAGQQHLYELELSPRPSLNSQGINTNQAKKTRYLVPSAEERRLIEESKTNGTYVSYSGGGLRRPRGTIAIQNLRDRQWQALVDADGFPNPPSTVTLDGNDLWIGGEAAIACVDVATCKVRKFCRIDANSVARIQVAGGYLWAQCEGCLYRVPLSGLQ